MEEHLGFLYSDQFRLLSIPLQLVIRIYINSALTNLLMIHNQFQNIGTSLVIVCLFPESDIFNYLVQIL